MCGRFTQFASWSEIREYFDLLGPARNLQPHYNIAPSQDVAAMRLGAEGKRELTMLR